MTLIAIYYTEILWGSGLLCAITLSLALLSTTLKKETLTNVFLTISIISLLIYAFLANVGQINTRLIWCVILGILEGLVFSLIKTLKHKKENHECK